MRRFRPDFLSLAETKQGRISAIAKKQAAMTLKADFGLDLINFMFLIAVLLVCCPPSI
jgi:hypothetical protein